MPMEVQSFSCPRCRRGEFRSLPGPNGKAFCPWCGDMVAAGSPIAEEAPLPELSLEELAQRMSGQPADQAAVQATPGAPASPAVPDLQSRLIESERRREAVEGELRREQEKRGEIKKAVLSEVGRLEADLAESRERIRRKDQEHAAALETLNLLKNAKEEEWNGDRMRFQVAAEEKEKALRSLQSRLEERQKGATEIQAVLDASRAEVGKLHAEIAKAVAEGTESRRKLSAADAKLLALKDAPAKLDSLKKQVQESQTKATGLQSELEKRDKRIKELQLLIKTLGERLNDLADRPRAGAPEGS